MKDEQYYVAIIIVNWNGKELLGPCFEALKKSTYKNFTTIMVDNGSTDNSVQFMKKNYPDINLIPMKTNTGFAHPNNVGITEAFKDPDVDAIIALNNDTEVDRTWLEELVKMAIAHPEAGSISSMAIFPGRKVIQNCGLSFERALKNDMEGGNSLGYGKKFKEVPQFEKEIEIFAAGGVAALYKREMLEEIGLFDADYFAYNEDLDLGIRARLFGYKCYMASKAKLTHYHSRTGGAASLKKIFWMERNTYYTAIKNLPWKLLFRFPYDNYVLKKRLFRSDNPSVKKARSKNSISALLFLYMKVVLYIIINSPKMFYRRHKIQKNKRVTDEEIYSWLKKFNRRKMENVR